MTTILVTGGAGFIGSNFVRFLQTKPDIDIIVVDAHTYAGVSDVEGVKTYSYSIQDKYSMEYVFNNNKIDVVVNFAAETHVDRSIVAPGAFVSTNILGVYTLLELCRERDIYFHQISTDEVYGSLEPNEPPFTEKSPYRPNSPYSASKASADHLVRAYGHTYGLKYTISNCSNNYGPYQLPEKLIPLTILRFMQGKPMFVYGDGEQRRDWIHVEDHCKAIWDILCVSAFGETYNVSYGREFSNLDIIGFIADIMDINFNYIKFINDRPGHDKRYALDSSKISKDLNWHKTISLYKGLVKTVQWYQDNMDWVNRVLSTPAFKDWMQKFYGEE